MVNRIKILLCICWLVWPCADTYAQDEYRWEWGATLGSSFYLGDANGSKPFKDAGLAGGFIARYLLNPHMAVKGNLTVGRISGDTRDFKNVYPNGEHVGFKRTLFDLGAQFEYNFWGYGANAYRGDRKFTPYILGGIGFTFAPKPAEGVFTMNFPIGMGLKYKVAQRINIGCELTARFTLSDRLDVTNTGGLKLEDPYLIKGKGLKNKDNYEFALFFLSYDFSLKCRDCNN